MSLNLLVSELTKRAANLQDSDANFENSFAQIARTVLRDRAPRLSQYEVGFQLLERDRNNHSAVGVMGYKVNDYWLFVPLFFINGQVKGHELLWVKNFNAFIPLRDNWLDFIFSRKGQEFARLIEEKKREEGVKPELWRLSRLPYYSKNAADEWKEGIELFKRAWSRLPSSVKQGLRQIDLVEFASGPQADRLLYPILKAASESPVYAAVLARFYPVDRIRQAIRQARESRQTFTKGAAVRRNEEIRIIEFGDQEFFSLPESQKEAAIKDGFVAIDNRPDKELQARVLDISPDEGQGEPLVRYFTNPTRPGVYRVLVYLGGAPRMLRCLVLPVIGTKNLPYGVREVVERAHAVQLDVDSLMLVYHPDSRAWNILPASDIHIPASEAIEYRAESLDEALNRLNNNPYDAGREEGAADQSLTAFVNTAVPSCFVLDVAKPRSTGSPGRGGSVEFVAYAEPPSPDAGKYRIEKVILEPNQEAKPFLDHVSRILFLPRKSTRFIRLNRKNRLEPADPIRLSKMAQARVAHLDIFREGRSLRISASLMRKADAARYLTKVAGLSGRDATRVVREAMKAPKKVRVWLRLADHIDPLEYHRKLAFTSSVPTTPENTEFYGHRATVPLSVAEPVPGMEGNRIFRTDPDEDFTPTPKPVNPNDPEIRRVLEAANRGRKEIFDLANLRQMLYNVGVDNLVDDYLRKMFNAMNTTGSFLALFYRYHDQLVERYGERDVPVLENLLRDTFNNLGDLVIFLKERAIGSAIGEEGVEAEVEEETE